MLTQDGVKKHLTCMKELFGLHPSTNNFQHNTAKIMIFLHLGKGDQHPLLRSTEKYQRKIKEKPVPKDLICKRKGRDIVLRSS